MEVKMEEQLIATGFIQIGDVIEVPTDAGWTSVFDTMTDEVDPERITSAIGMETERGLVKKVLVQPTYVVLTIGVDYGATWHEAGGTAKWDWTLVAPRNAASLVKVWRA